MATLVSAHGYITSPKARQPGSAFKEKCGQQLLSQQSSDINGNIQGMLQVAVNQKDFNAAECNVWLCKGFQFADNQNNVQSYAAGETVPIAVNIAAPHTGIANVTILDGKTGQAISAALKSFDDYASNSHTIPDDNRNFEITIPDLGGKCSTPGDCVIQYVSYLFKLSYTRLQSIRWIWDARSISQTYEACIDFTQGGSGGGSGSSPGGSSPPRTQKPAATSTRTAPTATSTFSTVVVSSTALPPRPTVSFAVKSQHGLCLQAISLVFRSLIPRPALLTIKQLPNLSRTWLKNILKIDYRGELCRKLVKKLYDLS